MTIKTNINKIVWHKSEGVSYVHTQFNSRPSIKTIYSHQRWVFIVVSSDFTTFLLVNTSPSSQSQCWGYYLLLFKSTKNNTSLTNAEYLLLHHATFLLVNMSPSSPSHWWGYHFESTKIKQYYSPTLSTSISNTIIFAPNPLATKRWFNI